jgi:transcription initiation factor TFIIIB Brf1 subunit/transcription initiation factor TFIIB
MFSELVTKFANCLLIVSEVGKHFKQLLRELQEAGLRSRRQAIRIPLTRHYIQHRFTKPCYLEPK